jgi:hypothetical protein
MTAEQFVAELRGRGFALTAHGTRLRWRAPKMVVTERDRVLMACYRRELLALLAAEARSAQPVRRGPQPEDYAAMHPCACGKRIPPTWERCTSCLPSWSQPTPQGGMTRGDAKSPFRELDGPASY